MAGVQTVFPEDSGVQQDSKALSPLLYVLSAQP